MILYQEQEAMLLMHPKTKVINSNDNSTMFELTLEDGSIELCHSFRLPDHCQYFGVDTDHRTYCNKLIDEQSIEVFGHRDDVL